MPRFNTTIDNVAPLIVYQPGLWIEGSASTDTQFNKYDSETFTLCTANGASATFSFNGTGVWLFGAKRGNHGPYSVTLDSSITKGDGFSSTDLFQVPLFSASNLSQGMHTVTLTNTMNDTNFPFLDLDFITWESEIGTDSEDITSLTVEDTDASFKYLPASAWNQNPPSVSSFSAGTGHSTATSGAFVSYNFTGDAVSVFGSVGPNNAPYTVQLDDQPFSTFNATKTNFVPRVMLYHADNLGPGAHSIKIVNQPAQDANLLTIDDAVMSTVPSLDSSPTGETSSSTSTSIGPLIGGIVAGFVVLAALCIAFYLYYRRRLRKRWGTDEIRPHRPSGGIVDLPMTYAIDAYPITTGSQQLAQSATRMPSVSRSQASYSTQSSVQVSNAGLGMNNTSSQRLLRSSQSQSESDGGDTMQNTDVSVPPVPPLKGSQRPLPPSASQSLSHHSDAELRDQRMVVDGRAQDFGTVRDLRSVDGEAMLPPDYNQATEVYEQRRGPEAF